MGGQSFDFKMENQDNYISRSRNIRTNFREIWQSVKKEIHLKSKQISFRPSTLNKSSVINFCKKL